MGDSRIIIAVIVGILILGTPGLHTTVSAAVGDIILADNNGRILRVTPSGTVTEIATGLAKPTGVALDSAGNIIFTETGAGRIMMIPSGGGLSVIADTGVGQPVGVEIDSDGNYIVVDNQGRLLKVTPGGIVSIITSTGLLAPFDVVIDSDGNYIVTDSIGSLLKITPGSTVSVIADSLSVIIGVEIDSSGNFIVTSISNLLKITPDGNTITTIATIPVLLFGVEMDSDESFIVSEQTTGSLYRVENGTPTLIATSLGNPLFLEIEQVVNNSPDCSGVVPDSAVFPAKFHKTVDVILSGFTDVDGDTVTFSIDSITQDEPTNGTGDGNKFPDGFGVGTDTPQIRVERAGTGDGRVYEISFTADDGNGGSCSSKVSVAVPHNQGHDAIDSGQIFDSTLPLP